MEDKLHPTVREFKDFLSRHPGLVKDIRKSGKSWQEPYEKWVLLGEDDPYWSQYKEMDEESDSKSTEEQGKSKQSELFGQLMKMAEKVDMDKVQQQVTQLSSTIATVQELIGQFQENKKSTPEPKNQSSPFNNWFRD
ncbi:spore coat protein YlbD [Lentibacillus sp. L22]|uniref:YlbD family protein n=1 Tax=Lentibacillus TaxID=175304 RepID=UPI0022B2102C|nr:spore coat protein YlbD [Lentibacillus daqui]